MSPLEKYASKKNLIARMAEALYGVKPGKHTTTFSGATLGGVLGGGIGGAAGGYLKGSKYLRKNKAAILRSKARPGERLGHVLEMLPMGVLSGIQGGIQGSSVGIPAGMLAGGALGKLIDKKRMAKYLARRKKVNIALGSGAGATGLAALAASKKGKKK